MPRGERRRASKPKVRTGCRTCKIRHVKCGEEKPNCYRCRKSGFECDGYADNYNDFSERAILPKVEQDLAKWMSDMTTSTLNAVERQWGGPKFETDADYQYFTFFQSKTVSHLSSYFDTDVWGRLILQACEHEEFARHGVLAISALNKAIETVSLGQGYLQDNCQIANAHHETALKHYAKSLKLMRERSADITDAYHLRNLLVSCLLTVCFETYHGNEASALKQAVSGIKLLSQFQEQLLSRSISMQGSTSSNVSIVDPDLVGAFVRLEIIVIKVMEIIPDRKHLHLQVQHATTELGNMPSEFSTLKEARHYWDIEIRRTIHLYHKTISCYHNGPMPSWGLLVSAEDFPIGIEVPGWMADTQAYDRKDSGPRQHLDVGVQWLQAFAPLFTRIRATPTHPDYRGVCVLMIYFLIARLSQPSSPDDQAIEDSVELLRLAKDVLEPLGTPSDGKNIGKPVFAFDGNLLSPIFCMVLHCRIRKTRWGGIALLKRYPRREGFLDSEMAAKVAEWFVNTEEEGIHDDEDVPADSRLILVNNNFNLAERQTVVKCVWQVKGQLAKDLPSISLRW